MALGAWAQGSAQVTSDSPGDTIPGISPPGAL